MAKASTVRVLLGLHVAPKESNGWSSAQLVFGQPLVLPGELKDVQETKAESFSTQLDSTDPPPTCSQLTTKKYFLTQ